MTAYREDRNLPRTVTLIAAVAAVLVTVLLPGIYYVGGRALLLHEISTKASVKAELVGHLAARSPDSWRYQDLRLVELLQRSPAEIGDDRASVVTADGRAIIEVGQPLQEPTLAVSSPVLDAGVQVGEVLIRRSLRPLLAKTLGLAGFGLTLGALVFLALRLLPLRALRAATASLHAHLRYQ